MNTAVYDNSFNANEWFVIISTLLFHAVMILLPRQIPRSAAINLYILGVFSGIFYDNSIGTSLFDLYDIGDDSTLTWLDYLTYVMYGPFGYLFVNIIVRYHLHGKRLITYFLGVCLFSLGYEAIATHFQVFHYKNNYSISYSLPIYILTLWLTYRFYQYIASGTEESK